MRKRSGRTGAPVRGGSRSRVYGFAMAIMAGVAVGASFYLPSNAGGSGSGPEWAPWGKAPSEELVADKVESDSGVLDLFALLPGVGSDVAPEAVHAQSDSPRKDSAPKAKKGSRRGSIVDQLTTPIAGPSIPPVGPSPSVSPSPSPSPSSSPSPSPSPSPTDGGEDPPLVPVTPPDTDAVLAEVTAAISGVLEQAGQLYMAIYQAISDLTAGLIPPLPTPEELLAEVSDLTPQAPTVEEIQAAVEELVPDGPTVDEILATVEELKPDSPTTEEVLGTVDDLTPDVPTADEILAAVEQIVPDGPTQEEILGMVDDLSSDVPTAEELEALVVGSVPEEAKALIQTIESVVLPLIEFGLDILLGDGSEPFLALIEQAKSENVDPAVDNAITTSGEAYATATVVADETTKQLEEEINASILTVTQTVGSAEEIHKGAEDAVSNHVNQVNEAIGTVGGSVENPPTSVETTFSVAINASDPVGTIVNLVEGHTYRFVIKGTYKYAMGSSMDMEADATCARKLVLTTGEITEYQQSAYTLEAGETPYENALEVSVSSQLLANEHADWRPDGDDRGSGCSESHVYTLEHLDGAPVGPGQAGQLHFRIIDWNNTYTDNAGALLLEVHDVAPVPGPSSSDLSGGIGGWMLLGILLSIAPRGLKWWKGSVRR